MAADKQQIRFGRTVISVSNLDKVFFPEEGITKGDLIEYYTAAAERMLPHLKERPLSFQRFPNGIDKEGFFQKDVPKHYPDWIDTTPVRKKGGINHQVIVDRKATLAYLANNGVVTIHGALSSEPDITKPDRLIFDLDPSVDDFGLIVRAAGIVREIVEDLGLASFVQVTGSRGLHVVSPIKPEHDFDVVGDLALAIARIVVDRDPDSFTIEHRKEKRGDRLLIDYFRNRYAQTAVVPYSIRARPGAPVATPLKWEELGRVKDAAAFTITNVLKRDDPWAGMSRRARSLKGPLGKLKINT